MHHRRLLSRLEPQVDRHVAEIAIRRGAHKLDRRSVFITLDIYELHGIDDSLQFSQVLYSSGPLDEYEVITFHGAKYAKVASIVSAYIDDCKLLGLSLVFTETEQISCSTDDAISLVTRDCFEVDVQVLFEALFVFLGRPGHQLAALGDAVAVVSADTHQLQSRLKMGTDRYPTELVAEVGLRLKAALLSLCFLFHEVEVISSLDILNASAVDVH